MDHYQFETEWTLTTSPEPVFDFLAAAENFADWWPAVTESEVLERGDAEGIGAQVAFRVRSPLLYSLNFRNTVTSIDRPRSIDFKVRGDLTGTGRYEIESGADGCAIVRIFWYVSTTKKWMNVVAPMARPLFVWGHNRLMEQAAKAVAGQLRAHVVSSATYLVGSRADEKVA
jgi:hypothetical protein